MIALTGSTPRIGGSRHPRPSGGSIRRSAASTSSRHRPCKGFGGDAACRPAGPDRWQRADPDTLQLVERRNDALVILAGSTPDIDLAALDAAADSLGRRPPKISRGGPGTAAHHQAPAAPDRRDEGLRRGSTRRPGPRWRATSPGWPRTPARSWAAWRPTTPCNRTTPASPPLPARGGGPDGKLTLGATSVPQGTSLTFTYSTLPATVSAKNWIAAMRRSSPANASGMSIEPGRPVPGDAVSTPGSRPG